jgi:DNA-binding NtrC family response regulator
VSWQDLVDPLGMVGSGTLFVEGVEHASLPVQLRLLHELEQAQLMRLRADDAAIQSPRIIASTTVSLTELVANGLFVDDLYWQLSAVTICIPSLSDRRADIAEIAQMLLAQIVATHCPAIQPCLTAEAIQQLQSYSWPGNFRELHSALQRAALLSTKPELSFDFSPTGSTNQQGSVLQENNLTTAATVAQPALGFAGLVQVVVQQGIIEADRGHKELHQFIVDQVESALISAILKECENVQTKTATRLGINRNTLHKKMKDFGLEPAS